MPKPSHVVIFDFDGTLIAQKYGSLMTVMDKALNENDRQVMDCLRERSLKKFAAGTIDPQEVRGLITIPISIYAGCGLNIQKVKEILSIVNLRKQVAETFEFLHRQKIPIAIISFGIFQFIETVLEQKNLKKYVSQIYAAKLLLGNRVVYGYQPETVVTDDKDIFSQDFARQYGVPAKNILAVGDSSADKNLGYFRCHRLGIAETEEEKQKIKKYFGEVVVTEDFGPVLEWLKKKN